MARCQRQPSRQLRDNPTTEQATLSANAEGDVDEVTTKQETPSTTASGDAENSTVKQHASAPLEVQIVGLQAQLASLKKQ